MQSNWRTIQLNTVDLAGHVDSDDDASLFRLFGFALHVGIKYRKIVLYGRLQKFFCQNRRNMYATELKILQELVETNTSDLPAVVRFQDRGKLTFPHRILLPFMRNCSVAIKHHLNCKQFKTQGKQVILKAKQSVLYDKELIKQLATIILYRCEHSTSASVEIIYRDMLKRVINTMANSLLSSQAMLERISKNKGVDAEMALRDKLKAYAMNQQSNIHLT